MADGAYHYRQHNVWSARQEKAWRQKVKDYGSSYRRRRRKAHIALEYDSEAAPRGWGYITVGERWGGRDKAVDEFLYRLGLWEAAEKNERVFQLSSPVPGIDWNYRVTLREKFDFNRQDLSSHIGIRVINEGNGGGNFYTYLCENERDLKYRQSFLEYPLGILPDSAERLRLWNEALLTFSATHSAFQIHVSQRVANRRGLLRDYLRNPNWDDASLDHGDILDPQERFYVVWELPPVLPISKLDSEVTTCASIRLDDGGCYALDFKSRHPLQVFADLTWIFDHLSLAKRVGVSTAGRRIIQ